jgi:hypothetical protein
METQEFVDMLIAGSSANDLSDKLKEILYSKSLENIESLKPYVANSMFGSENDSEEEGDEE